MKSILQGFIPIKLIGKGSFGTVYICEREYDKKKFAMKVIEKNTPFF